MEIFVVVLRFDVGFLISDETQATQVLPPRDWAVTLYSGSFAQLTVAYQQIYQQTLELTNVQPVGPPMMEVYHADSFVSKEATRYLEVFVPVVLDEVELRNGE